MLIAFEGIDGAGKSTVFTRLEKEISRTSFSSHVVFTRDPGGTRISEAIRKLIISPDYETMDPKTEALLYAAARRQNLVERINPALAANQVVLADRFVDSSLVYQGIGRGLGVTSVAKLNQFVLETTLVDLVIFFKISPEEAMLRLKKRNGIADRFEKEQIGFFQEIAVAYEHLIKKDPTHYLIIDAQQSLEEVYQAVKQVIYPIIEETLN